MSRFGPKASTAILVWEWLSFGQYTDAKDLDSVVQIVSTLDVCFDETLDIAPNVFVCVESCYRREFLNGKPTMVYCPAFVLYINTTAKNKGMYIRNVILKDDVLAIYTDLMSVVFKVNDSTKEAQRLVDTINPDRLLEEPYIIDDSYYQIDWESVRDDFDPTAS